METANVEPSAPFQPQAITDPAMVGALKLTDLAAEKVAEIRAAENEEAENIPDNFILRVTVKGGGCSGFQYDLYFDDPEEADYVFETNGVLLAADQMSFMYLMGTEIDYVDGLQGAGFKFNNPNISGSCGCGSSFSV